MGPHTVGLAQLPDELDTLWPMSWNAFLEK